MRLPTSLILLITAVCETAAAADQQDRLARQNELDAACEAARAEKLTILRQQLVAECMQNDDRSEEDCTAEYSHYGERAGNRAPLYYDLPACEAALEFQQSTRRPR